MGTSSIISPKKKLVSELMRRLGLDPASALSWRGQEQPQWWPTHCSRRDFKWRYAGASGPGSRRRQRLKRFERSRDAVPPDGPLTMAVISFGFSINRSQFPGEAGDQRVRDSVGFVPGLANYGDVNLAAGQPSGLTGNSIWIQF